ncbi:hypothetical protein [uncultured Tateyamaria sp.]|uniref:hypothetical protein n=1 Tax=Tateyamaria sp. 1078 TaxID=3417464 RepID=UPI0026326024|nr:hypothetical protein [uncultured Tateyamaria sp.]
MKTFLFAGLFCVCATVTQAQGYVCTLKTNGSSFAPEVLAMDFDSSGKTATVYGPVIEWAKGGPMKAKTRKRQDGQIEVRWSMTLPSRPIRAYARYRVVFNQDTKQTTLNATLRNADNDVSGRGTCAPEDWLPS